MPEHSLHSVGIRRRWIIVSSLIVLFVGLGLLSFVPLGDDNITPVNSLIKLLIDGVNSGDQSNLILDYLRKILSNPLTEDQFKRAVQEEGRANAASRIINEQLPLLQPKHPVVLIPGVISTGLEVWKGRPCAANYFRQRIWMGFAMLKMMILDRKCWLDHMRLDPDTGIEQSDLKLRPATGLVGSDYVIPGYWILGRIIEGLSDIGYDPNNMFCVGYDWRLDYFEAERRDGFLSQLKATIEMAVKRNNNQKVVLVGHSASAPLVHHFMKWVEVDPAKTSPWLHGGGGEPEWVAKHIHAVVNIGPSYLGGPKAVPCLVSGEMQDFAQMTWMESIVAESLMGKKERASVFRTLLGPIHLIPQGGSAVWGGLDDDLGDGVSAAMAEFRVNSSSHSVSNIAQQQLFELRTYSYDEILPLLKVFLPPGIYKRLEERSFPGLPTDNNEIAANDFRPNTWNNPLASRLPNAPDLTIYSLYGTGIPTEKAFIFELSPDDQVILDQQKQPAISLVPPLSSVDPENMRMPLTLATNATDIERHLQNGIYTVEGDGTIPLVSLGYVPAWAWRKQAALNPSGIRSIVREYKQSPGAPVTSYNIEHAHLVSHLGILNNREMIDDTIRIICGDADLPVDRINSNILQISERINNRTVNSNQ